MATSHLVEKTHDDNRSLWVDDRVEKNTISVTTSTFHQKHYIVFHSDSIDTVTYWKKKKTWWVRLLKVLKLHLKVSRSKHNSHSFRNSPVP